MRARSKTQWSGYEFYRKQVRPKRDFDSARSLSFPFPSSGVMARQASKQNTKTTPTPGKVRNRKTDGPTDGRKGRERKGTVARSSFAAKVSGVRRTQPQMEADYGLRRASANLFLERSWVRVSHEVANSSVWIAILGLSTVVHPCGNNGGDSERTYFPKRPFS